MIKDPLSGWLGPDPYDELAVVGVNPATPHADVIDASMKLLGRGGLTPQARRCWNTLRMIEQRLLVDLFWYNIDLAEEIAAAQASSSPVASAAGRPDVAQELEISESWLLEIDDDVRAPELPPVPPVAVIRDLELPSPGLLAGILRFDR